jgi:hypothetical protein
MASVSVNKAAAANNCGPVKRVIMFMEFTISGSSV